jgi:hypothetical protein
MILVRELSNPKGKLTPKLLDTEDDLKFSDSLRQAIAMFKLSNGQPPMQDSQLKYQTTRITETNDCNIPVGLSNNRER